ncbi:Nucleolar protein 56 [Dispira simplex]|nr:Nucleolar protein 56 [Dispira simplex]
MVTARQLKYVLFETASGYALFERKQMEEIGSKLDSVQDAVQDLGQFRKLVSLASFVPFKSAADALENANDVSEGVVSETLQAFLEMNIAKAAKREDVELGVGERNLAGAIKQALNVNCVTDDIVLELIRGLRLHGDKLLDQLKGDDLCRAQLGLGHSYSRAKVKFNVHRSDNMTIQAIAILDQLDKDINTFAMRIREWYSWHFPEMSKLVSDNGQYARLANLIGNKSTLSEEQLDAIEDIVGDPSKAKQILEVSRSSMGTDISEVDLLNIRNFATRLGSLVDYRKSMHEYLISKMNHVAPNLAALIGEMVGARLIAHAGSLTNLSKYPASTVQILGAEKALFRALKTRGKTPKYGLIYHSSFIGRAGAKNKGRISRFLANKCSVASRIDCFSERPTRKFGEALRGQMESRLAFYEDGTAPAKNIDVMEGVLKELEQENASAEAEKMEVDEQVPLKKRAVEEPQTDKKKKKKNAMEVDTPTPTGKSKAAAVETPSSSKKSKKKKKSKD